MSESATIHEQIAAVERALAMVREFAGAGEGLLGDAPTLRTIAGLEGAIATLRAGPQWRPIESAPRDGTHVLCFIPASPPSEPWLIYVLRHRTVWEEADGEQWARYEPTHWMPLPAPPSDAVPSAAGERE